MIAPLIRKFSSNIPIKIIKLFFNLWPPFLASGIKILEIRPDYRFLKVRLKLTWYNKNYVGTQFGGSIYSMTDPFYMYLLMNNLGSEYIVWDKAAKIDFIKPGKSSLYAEFHLNEKQIHEVKENTKNNQKYIFDLRVEIRDQDHILIASVLKTLYVRRKKLDS